MVITIQKTPLSKIKPSELGRMCLDELDAWDLAPASLMRGMRRIGFGGRARLQRK